ncbi:MAG: PadR family transcriptional regulator [Actinomycetota bacterium]|nr:PadR family transcriptional regulator [Actinomycetota bacterium]
MRSSDEAQDPATLLPLPAAAMYILTALGTGPLHGYGLMTEIRELSGGTVELGPGTLYGSVKRMLGQGLIAESDERPDPSLDDQRRRYYELTAFGARVAVAEQARLAELAAAAAARLPRWVPGTTG